MIDALYRFAAGIDIKASDIKLPTVNADGDQLDRIFGLVYMSMAAICLFFVIRGALLYVTHGSEPNSQKEARETILYALVALVGSSLVITIVQFVIKSVTQ